MLEIYANYVEWWSGGGGGYEAQLSIQNDDKSFNLKILIKKIYLQIGIYNVVAV